MKYRATTGLGLALAATVAAAVMASGCAGGRAKPTDRVLFRYGGVRFLAPAELGVTMQVDLVVALPSVQELGPADDPAIQRPSGEGEPAPVHRLRRRAGREIERLDQNVDGVAPAHLRVTLLDYDAELLAATEGTTEGRRAARLYFIPTREAGVANFAATYPAVADAAKALRDLLKTSFRETPDVLPFLPATGSPEVLFARVHRLRFQNGGGFACLAQRGEAPVALNNGDLMYVFQGLTDDGSVYVSAVFPVRAPGLPPGREWPVSIQEDKATTDTALSPGWTPGFADGQDLTRSLLEEGAADGMPPSPAWMPDLAAAKELPPPLKDETPAPAEPVEPPLDLAPSDSPGAEETFADYLRSETVRLEALDATEFRPDLERLDALFRSIAIGGEGQVAPPEPPAQDAGEGPGKAPTE